MRRLQLPDESRSRPGAARRRPALRMALFAAALLVAATGLAQLLPGPDERPASTPPAESPSGLAELRRHVERLEAELEIARAGHAALADEVERLRAAVLGSALTGADPSPDRGAPGADDSGVGAAFSGPPRFDREALLAAGFDPRDVDAFRARLDAIQLAQLELRDRAAREGWAGSSRHLRESRELAAELADTREDFGDELYDWMLYTTGRPNRVRVSDVMRGSAAEEAGLARGDVFLSYAGSRVFAAQDLREGTTRGAAGETTPVEVVRDDELVRVLVPRGPLGVTLQPSAREPAEVR